MAACSIDTPSRSNFWNNCFSLSFWCQLLKTRTASPMQWNFKNDVITVVGEGIVLHTNNQWLHLWIVIVPNSLSIFFPSNFYRKPMTSKLSQGQARDVSNHVVVEYTNFIGQHEPETQILDSNWSNSREANVDSGGKCSPVGLHLPPENFWNSWIRPKLFNRWCVFSNAVDISICPTRRNYTFASAGADALRRLIRNRIITI